MEMPSPVIDVSDASFESDVIEASRERPVVVDFWATWCPPCRALGPVLEQAVEEHGGVTLAKLDTDHNPQTAMRFGIRGIPAVKAFRDGQVVAEFVGAQPKRAVEAFLDGLAARGAAAAPPQDEAALRALLDAKPDNLAARRSLGRLLLDAGRLDDAEAVLGDGATDPVCDGLLARAELARSGDGAVVSVGGDDVGSLPAIIDAVAATSGETRARLRRVALGIIEAEKGRAPAVEAMRGRLASALF